jgi:hypothetical protein
VEPGALEDAGRFRPFLVTAFGKQRRDFVQDSAAFGAFCDPMFGFKTGLQYAFSPSFVIAPSVGVAVNLDESSRSAMFAELELNRRFSNGGLFGVGVGVWDLTDGDNRAGSLLVHTAFPLMEAQAGRGQLLFAIEGRLFLNQLDHIDNNYQGWVGLRYVFR